MALNVPLVSTAPCMRNLRNTIHRFPENKVRKGRMDCMRRWTIQGTVHPLPYVSHISPTPINPCMEMKYLVDLIDHDLIDLTLNCLWCIYSCLLILQCIARTIYAVACSTATSARSLCSLAHTHS